MEHSLSTFLETHTAIANAADLYKQGAAESTESTLMRYGTYSLETFFFFFSLFFFPYINTVVMFHGHGQYHIIVQNILLTGLLVLLLL